MAITNAQQYKQLLANGGRIGLKGGADASEFGKSGSNVNVSSSGSVSKSKSVSPGAGNSRRGDDGPDDRSSALQTYNTKKATGKLGRQDPMGGELQYRNGVLIDETGRPVDDTFRGGFTGDLTEDEKTLETFIDSKADYPKYTPEYVKFLADLNRRPNRKYFVENVLRAGKIPGVDYSMLGEDEFDIEQAYKDYMSNRLAGKTDAMGNPVQGFSYNDGVLTGNFIDNDGGGDQPYVPSTTPSDDTVDDRSELQKLIDQRGIAYRFMADGGRAEFAEGGGIESRLEQLGGDVSSAEQMLQAINQRLQTAESSLGSGGGGLGTLATLAGSNQPFNPGNFQPTIPADGKLPQNPLDPGSNANFLFGSINNSVITQPLGDPLQIGKLGQIPEQFRSGFDEYLKNNETSFGFGGQAISGVGLPGGGSVMFGDTGSAGAFRDYLKSTGFNPPSPLGQPLQSSLTATGGGMGSPLQTALGLADGGRAGMMDGGMMEDTPEGGIMDLESGRQMYFLGKLVKKATRAVKKIAKSPIGKAALLYAGGSFLGGGGGGITGIFGKDAFLRKTLLPKLYSQGKMTGLGKIALGGALTAAPLLFQEEEEQPDYASNRGPGLDIEAIRANPYNTMGSSYRFFAEGGDVEPVAKKTMPLLDMDGKEMDLRADGGFVPIGRMERADDVPARLSKNEFVFTADAVRNAGDGDIDKGAEVMYNMMKNLESGGEVSEESQGLDGAREMFQTSQRLEEVL